MEFKSYKAFINESLNEGLFSELDIIIDEIILGLEGDVYASEIKHLYNNKYAKVINIPWKDASKYVLDAVKKVVKVYESLNFDEFVEANVKKSTGKLKVNDIVFINAELYAEADKNDTIIVYDDNKVSYNIKKSDLKIEI